MSTASNNDSAKAKERKLTVTVIEPIAVRMEKELGHAPEKLRVAAYARVSTEQEEQQNSYEAQVSYYTDYIQSNPNWVFKGVFADEGITGTSTKNRAQFKSMVQLALAGEIDLILTKSISRFARNTVDTLQTVRELKEAGVEVIFEKENLHTFDPKCEVMLTIMSSLAQEESRSLSDNIRWGQQKSMQDGKVYLPYGSFLGYQKGPDGRPEVVEEEAKIVREIYDMYLSGMTIRQIANELMARGIPSPGGKKTWGASTVGSILTNEKYKGEAILQKTYTVDYLTKKIRKNRGEKKQYIVRNSHEAIIDPETFDHVQELMIRRRNQGAPVKGHNPFKARLICGQCGGTYRHRVWHKQLNPDRASVWCCEHRLEAEHTCDAPIIRDYEIKAAFERARKKIGDPKPAYSEAHWLDTVESVIVSKNGSCNFIFKDGQSAKVAL